MAKRILVLLISLVYGSAKHGYLGVLRLIGRTDWPKTLVVLTYHSVTADDVGNFETQMRQLTQRATPVFADDSLNSTGRQAVAVTFDDAFQCVFDWALPILAKHGIPATVFVPTGCLGGEAGWMGFKGDQPRSRPVVVAGATLASLDHRQVRLGSHTVTHPRLARLDGEQLEDELTTSRRTLEQITGAPVTMLALPYGSFSGHVIAAACRAGYRRVFANVPLPRDGRVSLLIGRVDASVRDWPVEFRLKIQGAYQWLAWAIPTKRAMLMFLGRSAAL